MDGSKTITVTTGKYTFQIIDNTLYSRDNNEIYSRSFKIGGNYPDCVNISIIYENNKPVDATMPYLLHLCTFKTPTLWAVMSERCDADCAFEMRNGVNDPECSFVNPLEKGSGTIIMIKALLQYVYKEIPSLTHIKFDDKSSIECATEEELQKSSRFRKKGTYTKPIPLYYFSIVFNGQTRYEKHFNAKLKYGITHQKYRERVTEFLYSPEFKANMHFDRFVSIFGKREEEMTELYQYYNTANTFDNFFQSISKSQRCRLVGSWIEQFMKFILKDVFYNENWIISFPLEMNGGNKIRNKNNKTRKYYCPNGMISNNYKSKNICISSVDL